MADTQVERFAKEHPILFRWEGFKLSLSMFFWRWRGPFACGRCGVGFWRETPGIGQFCPTCRREMPE